ncbi:hypothetical protein GWK47_001752 [Chionoecetes opilio]|uniref:Uncharacterized protein n=1 Tax=Chionoecetes opilio TaxID=41210 RepID=A0A8J4XVE3_CHIOP|nr:hypothetical protein GWK47_001752 [Chionoecetes opilio]
MRREWRPWRHINTIQACTDNTYPEAKKVQKRASAGSEEVSGQARGGERGGVVIVIALLPIEVPLLHRPPGAVARSTRCKCAPSALGCCWVGVQWVVVSGCSVTRPLPLPGSPALGVSGERLCVRPASRLRLSCCMMGGTCMVTLGPLALGRGQSAPRYSDPTWMGIQLSMNTPPCAPRLCRLQGCVDEPHVVLGMWLLEACKPCPGVRWLLPRCLPSVQGMFEGVLDGHQLSLEGGAVVRRPPRHFCPTRGRTGPWFGHYAGSARAVSEVYAAVPRDDLGMAISACCRSSEW